VRKKVACHEFEIVPLPCPHGCRQDCDFKTTMYLYQPIEHKNKCNVLYVFVCALKINYGIG